MEMIGAALYIANIFLTSALLYIYAQNYSKIRSKYTIGLMTFVGVFLVHSALSLYFALAGIMYSDKQAEIAFMVLEALKVISFAVLLKISWE